MLHVQRQTTGYTRGTLEAVIRNFLLFMCAFIPFTLSAQTAYSDSLFHLGADPDNIQPIGLTGKLSIHAQRAFGPRVLVAYLFVAGVDQWTNTPGAWGRGGDGYAKRYGSNVGTNAVREVLSFGLDGVLRTDPRIYRSKRTSTMGRLGDAVLQVIVTRTDSGHRTLAVAELGSAFGAGQISRLWLPSRDSSFGDGLYNGGTIILGDVARNVFREFWPDVRRKFHH